MASMGCLDELEKMSAPLVVFGYASAVLVCLEQLPQYLKIVRNDYSTEGLSAATLAIGNTSSALNVVNLSILHANQIKMCFDGMPRSLFACQPSLLVLISGACGMLATFPLYCFALKHALRCGGGQKRKWVLAGLAVQLTVAVGAGVPAARAILPGGRCQEFQDYANTIGFLNTVLLCSQFAPQIYTSYVHKGSGAVSYATLLMDGVGGFLMVGYRIFATKERLSSWFPYLVFHTSELCVVAVAAYFDSGAARRSLKYRVSPITSRSESGAREGGNGQVARKRTLTLESRENSPLMGDGDGHDSALIT